ncbi:MAG: S9 family peptidase [Anaerolineales bacterium]|nr:S9 family peptidase [Anaerolineales bacterium]
MMLDLKTLLQVPYVESSTGFDISPDGRKVAFSWNKTGQWEIYELSLTGRQTPRKISAGPGGKFGPQYSPEGARLAYLVDFNGSEAYHLFLQDFIAGTVLDLTPGIQFSLQTNIAWSPDGNAIVFLADRDRNFDAFVMDLATPLPEDQAAETRFPIRRILGINRPAWSVKWSPDGAWLAVVFEGPGQDYLTCLVRPDGSESRPVAVQGTPIDARNPAWSPGGKRLAFASDFPGWHTIGILELEKGEIAWLKGSQAERYAPAWSPDGKNLVYVAADGAETWLELRREANPPLRLQQMEPGMHYTPAFTPDGDSLVFIFDNPGHPDDLWEFSFRERSLRQLTQSLPAALRKTNFILPDEVIYPGLDGQMVPALLFRPADVGPKSPAVIVIHGGPTWHFSYTWYPFMAHMVSRGWTVLAPNYRGSTGYGREWQTLNRYDLGGGDADDCAAGAQYLVREGLADPQRIAVTGRSHGGYLTMSCLTRHPDLWAGGSAIVPFLNLFNCHEELREDLKHWDIENMGPPDENYELWRERSPYFFLDRVLAPVQIICGENDPRCPASDSIAARDKLLELGRPADFKMYAGEGHSFLKIENVLDSEMRRVAFLARVLA